MATSKSLFDAIEARRTFYQISEESSIPDSRIEEIVSFAIKHCPSAFNVQSARCVILLRDEHKKLWDIADEVIKSTLPEEAYKFLGPRVAGFRRGYGTVMFLEDQESLIGLSTKNPMIKDLIPEWSDHSSGMHQFTVWTAFEAEGLGCSLQHYNYSPKFAAQVAEQWNIPASWKLKSQLVFGKPVAGPDRVKTFLPIEERVKIFRGK